MSASSSSRTQHYDTNRPTYFPACFKRPVIHS